MTADAHEQAPDAVWECFKAYRKLPTKAVDEDLAVVDFRRGLTPSQEAQFRCSDWCSRDQLKNAIEAFMNDAGQSPRHDAKSLAKENPCTTAYTHTDLPELTIIPGLLPPSVLSELLSRAFHRDLSVAQHKTNLHLHYNVAYPADGQSFFKLEPASRDSFLPKDPSVHKPLTVERVLNKKLRWMTLGGQYDWTEKVYPEEVPPIFPRDIGRLLESLFPETTAEAAIVNLYSPGDTLSLHRDVAEASERGLISVSISCDALFVIGSEDEDGKCHKLVLRLRSGDIVYMAGASRFAWHGVPLILPNTCPVELSHWPACGTVDDADYERWRSWIATKRININVRQMT